MPFYSWQEDIEKTCARCGTLLYVYTIPFFNLCVSVYSWHCRDIKRVYWTCAYISPTYVNVMVFNATFNNISLGNPTYIPTTLMKDKILYNHRSVLCSFGISTKDEELDLSSLYWIPKLHKCSFKQRYIAESAKCSTKPLSKLLTCILSAVKTGLQSYCNSSYSRGGVNQMWILKNSKDLLEYILSSCNSIKKFDFSTLYTTIPHSKLKGQIKGVGPTVFHEKEWPTYM